MNNSIKRAQSQARLSFAERENFRPKVRQLKKTLLTLVALLAVTTGTWAQTETLLTTITATDKEQASYSTANVATVSFSNLPSTATDTYGSYYLANWGWYGYGWSATVNAAEGYTITKCIFYDDKDRTATDSEAPFVVETEKEDKTPRVNGTPIKVDQSKGIKKIEVYGYVTPAASGPTVDWNKTSKTGSFTMPGGNVTLEPEYYPQAALTAAPTAINDVPATTDGAIVNTGTVANIGETTNAQGTVMYYVSQTALDDAALQALAADQWTADVPTAQSLAQGQAYVYYYVRGNDGDTDETTFSDGDIVKAANAITVTLGAAPTYAVTFADDLTEPDKWTASPNAGVVKGTEVTVTYTGTKKVIGVKAEKKAAAAPKDAKDATAEDLGKVIGADGNIYDDADAATAANTTTVAMIAYVGSSTEHATYTHGLAIALADESSSNWSTAKSTCEGKSAVTNAAWLMPSQNQWKAMFKAFGDNDASYIGLNTAITNAGGTALQETDYYWSSTPVSDFGAWVVNLNGGVAGWKMDAVAPDHRVRACFAF